MAFPHKLLNEGEDTVLDLHPHWWSLAAETVAFAAAFVFGILTLVAWDVGLLRLLAGVLLLASIAYWVRGYLEWRTTNFVVTTDRLIYRSGVVAKQGIEIPLDRVNNVLFSQRVAERLLGFGDLVIESAGESGRQAFSDVRKPSAVQNEIYKQIEANENRKFDRIGSAPSAPTSASVADELAKLDELRRSGVLSDEEFAAQKARLLGQG